MSIRHDMSGGEAAGDVYLGTVGIQRVLELRSGWIIQERG